MRLRRECTGTGILSVYGTRVCGFGSFSEREGEPKLSLYDMISHMQASCVRIIYTKSGEFLDCQTAVPVLIIL